jgi:dihydroxyacetone kinase
VSDDLRGAILAAADAVDAARGELGRLDGAAGDGDHGMTMSIGARNVRRKLAALPADAPPGDVLRATSEAMAGVGGAIGPLYSGALAAIAGEVDGPGWSTMTPVTRLRTIAEAAERAITALGHAAPGDKTVVDALHPLAASLRDAETAGTEPGAAALDAVAAAEAGTASTADMVARLGRASRLGERSRGLPDAGATSFSIIARALVEALTGSRPEAG